MPPKAKAPGGKALRDKQQQQIDRMRAAGMIVPDVMPADQRPKFDNRVVKNTAPVEPKKKGGDKQHVDPFVGTKKEHSGPEDGLLNDREAQMERLEARESGAEKEARESAKPKEAAKAAAAKAEAEADAEMLKSMRSPICCVLGHVDTGKTSLLDRIRATNVQGGEAGGITQQIGATFFPRENLLSATQKLNEKYKHELKVPGLLVIDTPGYESFTNLRSRGSSLCDIAVLVVDIMHGLEAQTRESIRLLKERKCLFIVALNKIDRLLDWEASPNEDIESCLARQKPHVISEFDTRVSGIMTEFAEESLNAQLYYKNKSQTNVVSLVPTSAKTGEGICDLLLLKIQLVQKFMENEIMYKNELQCTILEVKPVQGLGTTIDVILVNGKLKEGQPIMVCGRNGPIRSQIRSLLTPQPMRELRVKAEYVHHAEIRAAIGVKIAAPDLEETIPGTPLFVVNDTDNIQLMRKQVMSDVDSILSNVAKVGVSVQSSTLGSLEALLSFLKQSCIPVSSINLGPIHKRHILQAIATKEKNPRYAVVLAFDVTISKEAQELADKSGIPIMSARVIYHLFDAFTKYNKDYEAMQTERNRRIAVFPAVLNGFVQIRNKDPIIIQAHVHKGQLHPGTPLCLMHGTTKAVIGKVTSLERDGEEVNVAKQGTDVTVTITCDDPATCFGRHFNEQSVLSSSLTRESVDALKESFRDQMSVDDWYVMKDQMREQGIQSKPAAK